MVDESSGLMNPLHMRLNLIARAFVSVLHPWALPLRSLMRRGRTVMALALSLLLAAPASATWSIVVLNRATGELAVATSTCISNFDISTAVPVIRVGYAAGAAQSFVISSATNRRRIFRNALRGATPQELLDYIESVDGGFESRQFGLVAFSGPPVTHTGTQNGVFANGVTGQFHEYEYAIQGNVLTGNNVVLDCEMAFLNTNGDLGQRMIAAMEAARDAGGDGRCSCSAGNTTGCGSPPPSFQYASYNAFMAIARLGDMDAPCLGGTGCANGDYYMRLNYVGNNVSQEPIAALRDQYDTWRAGLVGEADHVNSALQVGANQLQADGVTRTTIQVDLKDLDGVPLGVGGQILSVIRTEGDAIATFENFVDNGDGTHSLEMVSTLLEGDAQFAVVVGGGARPVQLFPSVAVTSVSPVELLIGRTELSASKAIPLPIFINAGPSAAGDTYRVLGSLSGTSPGQVLGNTMIPLNPDRFFDFTVTWAGGSPFLGNAGSLDATGRAQALFAPRAGGFSALVGTEISFSAWLGGTSATAPASVPITL
ncbi:MAG: hypothetical protein ACJAZN_000035 [Planctomycetota bacterium]|jgi:hypothetical protein